MRLNGREFPSNMEQHLQCQNATDMQLDTLTPFARYHRKHLGFKSSLLTVNKQCSPFAALKACKNLPVLDGYAGDHNSWEFHVLHMSEGVPVELLVNDVAEYLAETQPWQDGEFRNCPKFL